MIKIAICDDEKAQRDHLKEAVHRWAAKNDISVKISVYINAESFLLAFEDDKSADILLLDIQMGETDGITLAKKVRADNNEIQIIFVTGYMEYIADGYDVEALNYLLKPVTEEKLSAVLDRAVEKLAHNERALYISQSGESIRIPMYTIRYLEVSHNYVTIHANEEFIIKKTLGEIEKELDDGFFRTGRSFIVNLKFIRKVTKNDIFMSDGKTVPLSRGLYKDINRAIIEKF